MKGFSQYLRKPLIITICILMLLTGCAAPQTSENSADVRTASAEEEQRMVFSIEPLEGTDKLGKALSLVKSQENIFIGGTTGNPTLAKYNLETDELKMLKVDDSHDDTKRIYAMTADANQDVYLLTGSHPEYYLLDGELVNNQEHQRVYSLLSYEANGNFKSRIPLSSLDCTMPYGILIDKDENVICWDDKSIYAFDLTGDELFRLDSPNRQIMNVGFDNGNFLVHVSENEKTGIYQLDMSKKSWGSFTEDAETTKESNTFQGTSIADDLYLINTGTEIKKYNPDTKNFDPILSPPDLDNSAVTSLLSAGENQYYILNGTSNEICFIKGELKNISDIPTLKIASGYMDHEFEQLIEEFEKTHPEYEIEVSTYEDREGADRLVSEIQSGDVPDILDLTSLYYFTPLMEEKILEDLNPYLNDIDLIPNLRSAMELNGHLYSIPSSFVIRTFMIDSSLVPDKTSWTVDEMDEIFAASGKAHKLEATFIKSVLLGYIGTYALSSYMDYTNNTCSFDRDELIKWLELCKEMPDDLVPDHVEYDKDAMLRVGWIQNLNTVMRPVDLFNGNYTYIGLPNDNIDGSLFGFMSIRLGIPTQSQNKEAAWSFISTALTDEYQQSVNFFPVSQRIFDKNLSLSLDNHEQEFPYLSQADAKKLTDLISSTTTIEINDFPLQDIITEESAYYFDGTKTVEEVADNIQNRTNTFLAEHQ